MHDLNYQLQGLCNRCREGSYSTQIARRRCLDLAGNQLHSLGFRHLSANGLKPKHVEALVTLWKDTSIAPGTIKNRLSHLRWWAEKVKKPDIIPASNSDLGIAPRSYIPDISKAISLTEEQLNLISDPFVRCSLLLQAAFGLRREECIKFTPSWADKGDSIYLKGSWCKGGQSRSIPITNDNQRVVLDLAHSIAGKSSLIPAHRSYFQHLKVYEAQTSRAGLHNLHGLRHNYAQQRFFQLTGSLCSFSLNSLHTTSLEPDHISFNDNLDSSTKLSDQQKELHRQARLTISKELGHHRLQVTSVYLGKPLTKPQSNPSNSLTNPQSNPLS